MTEESLKRANEIELIRSQLLSIQFDKFTNGTIKIYTKDLNGAYLNKELSVEILNFFEGLKNKYKKELEAL